MLESEKREDEDIMKNYFAGIGRRRKRKKIKMEEELVFPKVQSSYI